LTGEEYHLYSFPVTNIQQGIKTVIRYYVEYINEDRMEDIVYLYAPSETAVKNMMANYEIVLIDQTD